MLPGAALAFGSRLHVGVILTVAAVAGGAGVWQPAACGRHVGRRLHAGVGSS